MLLLCRSMLSGGSIRQPLRLNACGFFMTGRSKDDGLAAFCKDAAIYSVDASGHGAGFICLAGRSPGCKESLEMPALSCPAEQTLINILEFFSCCQAVEHGYSTGEGRIFVYCDNVTAVAWVNRTSHNSTADRHYCDSLVNRLRIIRCAGVQIEAIHVPGVLNSAADELSRPLDCKTNEDIHWSVEMFTLSSPLPITGPIWVYSDLLPLAWRQGYRFAPYASAFCGTRTGSKGGCEVSLRGHFFLMEIGRGLLCCCDFGYAEKRIPSLFANHSARIRGALSPGLIPHEFCPDLQCEAECKYHKLEVSSGIFLDRYDNALP